MGLTREFRTFRAYTVSQKTVQNDFHQNFVKFPPILIIFGRMMAKRLKLCTVHSISTSTNSRHHTTVLYADDPNCCTTLKVAICNKLSNDLVHSKLKCGLFSRIIGLSLYNSLVQNCQNLCLKCAPRTRPQALRRQRHWLIAASTIDWSNCAHFKESSDINFSRKQQ